MKEVTMETAYMASLFVEGVMYGMYIICFIASSVALYTRTNKWNGLCCVFAVSIMMFVVGTTHMAVNCYRLLSGFVLMTRDPLNGKLMVPIGDASFLVKNATYMIQTLLGDGFLLYRLYVTWNGDKLVCLPFIACFLACTGVGVQMLNSQALANPSSDIFGPGMRPWLVAFFSITLFTDLSCSLLIGVRIWWINRRMQKFGPTARLVRAAIIIVESGVVYSISLAILLVLYLGNTLAHKIVLDAVTQLIGIVFSVIIIRLVFCVSTNDRTTRLKLDTLFFTQDQNMSRIATRDQEDPSSVDESMNSSLPPKGDAGTSLPLRGLGESRGLRY